MKPIVLIGMMGSGKTTVGKALSTKLNQSWIDTDIYIEEMTKQSIPQLFEQKGETYFRKCETKALLQLIHDTGIISTGGGIIVTDQNRQLLKEQAIVVYLKTSISTLIKRLDITNRPLLQNENIEVKLTRLFTARQPLYSECAHLTIETDTLTVNEVVTQLLNELPIK